MALPAVVALAPIAAQVMSDKRKAEIEKGPEAIKSIEAPAETQVSMLRYAMIAIAIIAVMLVIWMMTRKPIKAEYRSILDFTTGPGLYLQPRRENLKRLTTRGNSQFGIYGLA